MVRRQGSEGRSREVEGMEEGDLEDKGGKGLDKEGCRGGRRVV